VFPNRLGRPTDHDNLYYQEFKPLLKNAGLGDKGFTFHSLRHTFATPFFKQRQHPKIIQSLMGHASITQTMDTYSHLLEDIGGDAVDGLDEASVELPSLATFHKQLGARNKLCHKYVST
jgi:integrase